MVIAAWLIFFWVVGQSIHDAYYHPYVCEKSGKVTAILSIDYRSATIQFADGKTMIVNQARLKPGDDFCEDWERK